MNFRGGSHHPPNENCGLMKRSPLRLNSLGGKLLGLICEQVSNEKSPGCIGYILRGGTDTATVTG